MANAFILGKKLYFRSLERSDIDLGWHQWINDTAVNQGLFTAIPVTHDALVKYYESSQQNDTVMFAICDRSNDKYIGNCRLGSINWINRSCTYGRLIGDANYRGKGYGLEILELLFRYGFHTLGMERIYSSALATNIMSVKNNEKFGMKVEGIQRRSVFRDGAFHDGVMLAMLRSEFEELYPSKD